MNAKDYLNKCHFGDVREVLRRMIDDGVKVNTIITSPPYWGLRDYGHAGQLGLEPTIHEFIANMVDVFELCRQVLADDGTAWVNMGDCYATGAGKVGLHPGGGAQGAAWAGANVAQAGDVGSRIGPMTQPNRLPQPGLKPKDLVGQPWRLALAMQDAGWWLRSDIIWSKPNPMPESCRDRPTRSHEYLFLLAKSEHYYFDFQAFKEPVTGGAHARRKSVAGWSDSEGAHDTIAHNTPKARGVGFGHGSDAAQRSRGRIKNNDSMDAALASMPNSRNRRTVWTIPTQGYHGAHFATFPEALVEPPILAATKPGGVVLDIFFGTGTTGQVAQRLGRNFIGIDLNPDYKALQDERLRQPSLALEPVCE